MQFGIISEVLSDGRICMLPSAFAGIRNLVLANIDGHRVSDFNGEKQGGSYAIRMTADKDDARLVQDYVGDARMIKYWEDLNPEDRVVNMVRLTGPMTRNGAECSIGTKGLRDKICYASDMEQCQGHIIYCDTPGGMASSVQDLRMAIDYSHSKGKKVYMLIDGMCASGGAFASSLCDGVFFVNPDDEIGSIGMYAAFFTLEDGAKHAITSEVYHEVYATASANKNEWYREAAAGNTKMVEDDVNRDLAEMLERMKLDRPSILAEQMTGKMYKMKDVVGTLVDGQSDIPALATLILEDFAARNGEALPPTAGGSYIVSEGAPEEDPAEDPEEDPNSPSDGNQPEDTNTQSMKQYTAIPAAIGEEAMESADGTLFLQEQQAEALENLLQSGQNREAELQQQIDNLNTQMSEQQTNAAAQLAAQTEQNEQLQQQLASLQSELEQARNVAEERLTSLNNAQTELEQARQQVTDLTATVEELNAAQGAQPDAGEAPSTAGQGAPVTKIVSTRFTYDRTLSAKENAARYRQSVGKK